MLPMAWYGMAWYGMVWYGTDGVVSGRPGGLPAGASLGTGSCHQPNSTTVSSLHFCPVPSVHSAQGTGIWFSVCTAHSAY